MRRIGVQLAPAISLKVTHPDQETLRIKGKIKMVTKTYLVPDLPLAYSNFEKIYGHAPTRAERELIMQRIDESQVTILVPWMGR